VQVAYRATSLADAHRARDVLAEAHIESHIADEALWAHAGLAGSTDSVIRVMVDNRCMDQARRALKRLAQPAAALGAQDDDV